MIHRTEPTITLAICDACNSSLIGKDPRFGYHGAHVIAHFGYGSRFDGWLPRHVDLCDSCWEKALTTIGIVPKEFDSEIESEDEYDSLHKGLE